MNPQAGRCAILFPHGVLFRDEEKAMRERVVAADVIDAVVGLGPNLFYNSPMEACVIVCRAQKPGGRRGKILFIDAVNEVTRERAQSFLRPEHIDRIEQAYLRSSEEDGFSRITSLEEIARNDFNLSIPLYVRRTEAAQSIDRSLALHEAIEVWLESSATLRVSMAELMTALQGTGDDC
jgi:type I restriction enzyme M protein